MAVLLLGVIFFSEKHSKILAANSLATHAMILACLYPNLTVDSNSIDIALVYSLTAFIGLVAVTSFVLYGGVGKR
ncbi:putative multiple resistance and pH regulation protein F [Neorickettsia helminthoeca str. Oregon]|uniref:Putative multiple resistance and pH regulation protein F n=2 Tax=Neorickettsia helminthoeca TaxID=33994 RepID=X5H357_9RICK|nr:putative multiple resistance and pH regulation protein F [Neorickettsia helminthoeca str. Oregon]